MKLEKGRTKIACVRDLKREFGLLTFKFTGSSDTKHTHSDTHTDLTQTHTHTTHTHKHKHCWYKVCAHHRAVARARGRAPCGRSHLPVATSQPNAGGRDWLWSREDRASSIRNSWDLPESNIG